MRARGTLILFAIFVAVAGYIYVVDRRSSRPDEGAPTNLVLDLDPAAIDAVRIAWQESTIALARRDGRWQVTEPIRTLADETAVARLTAAFDSLTAERRIPWADIDSTATGLDAPWALIEFQAGDSLYHEVAVGALNPTGSAYYARIDHEPEMVLLDLDTVHSPFRSQLISLRERRILHFDPEAARYIELAGNGRRIELGAEDGAWRLVNPPLAADQSAVRELLTRLTGLEAGSFTTESPGEADLERVGLEPPLMTVVVRGAGDSLLAHLEVGAATAHSGFFELGTGREKPGRFARGDVLPAIAIVPDLDPDELVPSTFQLRDKRLFDLGGAEIDSLEVTGGNLTVAAGRDSAGEFHRVAESGAASKDVDENMTRLAANLPQITVTQFADENALGPSALRRFGLDPGHLRLRLRLSDGGTRILLLGDAAPRGLGVYAHRTGTPGVVVVGHATAGDLLDLVFGQRTLPPPTSERSGS